MEKSARTQAPTWRQRPDPKLVGNHRGFSRLGIPLLTSILVVCAMFSGAFSPSSNSGSFSFDQLSSFSKEQEDLSGSTNSSLFIPSQSLANKGPLTTSTFSISDLIQPINAKFQSLISPATNWIKLRVNKGDTISAIFSKFGLDNTSARNAELAIRKRAPTLLALKTGEEIDIELNPTGQIQSLRKESRDGKILVLERDPRSEFKTTLITPDILEHEREVSGVITSSLAQAAKSSNIPYETIDEFVDLLADRVRFERDLQPGDTFSLIYKVRTKSDGTVLENGEILAASLKNNGRFIAAVQNRDSNGKARYFSEKGESIGGGFLKYPVKFSRISSTFSSSRFHPVLKIHRPHNGVDFAAPTGTPVRTVGDGIVVFAGWKNGGGYTVRVKHSDRWSTDYMHLSKIDSRARLGARVSRGDEIGKVGATGLATAPHLHFALWDRSKFVNPLGAELPKIENYKPADKQLLLASISRIENLHTTNNGSVDRMIALHRIPGSSSQPFDVAANQENNRTSVQG